MSYILKSELYTFDFFMFSFLKFFRSSEGKTVEVPYKGPVESTVLDILGGLRSACTYTGAERLRELPRRATFIRCTQQLNPMYGPPPEI